MQKGSIVDLLQCDPVAGVEHFRTPVSRGIEIMKHLYRNVGGLGVPRFVVDAVDGGGKVPIDPSYVVRHQGGTLTLRNFAGEIVTYPDLPGRAHSPAAPDQTGTA